MDNSRLTRKEESRAYRKIFLAFFSAIIIIVFIIFFGLPALINLAAFISGMRGEGDLPANQQNIPLSPPVLELPYEATNAAKISVKGFGTPGARVELFVNGNSFKKILIPKDGTITFDGVLLDKGDNQIWGVSENSLKVKSSRSRILSISYKNETPKMEIAEPDDGASVKGDQKEVKVSGQTEPGINITINNRFVILDSESKFSYNLPLKDGENIIEIVATDNFGNTSKVERKVTYSP